MEKGTIERIQRLEDAVANSSGDGAVRLFVACGWLALAQVHEDDELSRVCAAKAEAELAALEVLVTSSCEKQERRVEPEWPVAAG